MTLKGGLNFMQSKTRWWILGTGGTAVVAVIATAGYLLLMPGPPSKYVTNSPVTDPQPLSANDVAHDYAQSFGALDASAAAALTDDPTASTAALTTLYKNMSAARLTASVAGDAANNAATVNVDWRLGQFDLPYQVTLQLVQRNGKWLVHWSDADIHPELAKGQSLTLRTTPGGSTLTDRDGKPMQLDAVPKTLKAGVQQAIGGDLQAVDGHSITIVDAAGTDVKTLGQQEGTKKAAYALTIDAGTQAAAQKAVDGFQGAATLVAMQASTGEILSVATNAAFDSSGLSPLTGTFPPGSTFKIVTATAALQHGVTGNSAVSCPPTVHIGPRTVPNEDGVVAGSPPDYATQVHTAFAKSCNTTFAQLAANLGANDLPTAARQLGLGVDYDIPGITTNTGRVDTATDEVDRAVDGFGQGTDLVSPFGMAVVAATVHNGQAPTPVLIRGQQTTAQGMVAAPPVSVLNQVRTMMHEVCTPVGTAHALASLPNTFGKTGTAEVGDGPAHGWFVGYRNDVAFAVLLPHADSSGPAVNVAGTFLRAIG
ncbi:penicillin-binding transpeptidase domain-containing protein [Kutzneria kofuensis]|uniref:Membrane peptidoglycan carboxypeptidase n=1 Tax=Kutzneria kofuensis TaxID=103725 RepID=A0A7W9NDS4_9PSEU|nr:penicillin-binding transpeptidase domain-containing protein [Kutzneria kofuensis]MBB5888890.1 membrane peptidoglycan carboxypeptidase [Kutzneria kofuensis]